MLCNFIHLHTYTGVYVCIKINLWSIRLKIYHEDKIKVEVHGAETVIDRGEQSGISEVGNGIHLSHWTKIKHGTFVSEVLQGSLEADNKQ